MDKIRRLPISVKIIVIIGGVWIIFSAVMVSVFFRLSQLISDRLVANQEDKINYFSAAVNKDIQNTVQKLVELSVNENILSFVRRKKEEFNYKEYEIYRNAYKELSSCFASSMYIDDVFLYNWGNGELLSVDKSLYSLEESETEGWLKEGIETGAECIYGDDQIVYLYYTENSELTMGMKISLQQIKNTLQSYESERDYQFFFVSANNYEYLGNGSGDSELEKSIYEKIDWNNRKEEYKVKKNSYIVRCLGNSYNQFYIVMYSDKKDVLADVYYMWWILGILLILFSVISLVLFFGIRKMIMRPMGKLEYAMKKIEDDCYSISLKLDESMEFSYVFRQFNKMAEKIRTLIQEVLEEKILMEQIKNRQLSLQINPHFLFNSLYMGYRLAKADDMESVAELCLYLGDYFGVLTYASKEYIRLENEIQFTQAYLKLNKMRYGERLEYSLIWDEKLRDEKILPLLLQPLLGFLIQEGVEKSSHPVCRIVIEITDKNEWIYFKIRENSGVFDQSMVLKILKVIQGDAMPEEYFELWNLKHRIEGMYELENGIDICQKNKCLYIVYAMEKRGSLEQYV